MILRKIINIVNVLTDLRFKLHSYGAKAGGGATMTGLVHEQNRYTSGIMHSFRFEPGRRYYLTVYQVDALAVIDATASLSSSREELNIEHSCL